MSKYDQKMYYVIHTMRPDGTWKRRGEALTKGQAERKAEPYYAEGLTVHIEAIYR